MYDCIDELIADYGESVTYDTLYYACECGDEMLARQTAYFEYMLFNDEREYYVECMTNDLLRKEWLENTISVVEKAIAGGQGFAAEYINAYEQVYNYLLSYFLPDLSDPHFRQDAAQEIGQNERMAYCRYMAAWLPHEPHDDQILNKLKQLCESDCKAVCL